MSFGIFPLSQQLKGSFPENSIKGQICMKLDFQLDKVNTTHRLSNLVVPTLMLVFHLRQRKSIKEYVAGQNLKKRTFSQFGGVIRRNLFSADQTSFYFLVCLSCVFIDNGLILLFQMYQGVFHKDTRFIIHSLLWVSVMCAFFGVYVPIKHYFESRSSLPHIWVENREKESNTFYITGYSITPRRYILSQE